MKNEKKIQRKMKIFKKRRRTQKVLLLENRPFSTNVIKTYCDLLIENTKKANDPTELFYKVSLISYENHPKKEEIDLFLRELSNATSIQEIEKLRSKLNALKASFLNDLADLATQLENRFLNKECALHLVLWLSDLRVKGLTGSYDLDAMFRSKEQKVIKLYDYFEIKIPFTFSSLSAFLALMDKIKKNTVNDDPSDYLVYSNENGVKAYWLATHALVRQLCVGSHWCIYTNLDGSTFLNYVYGDAKRTFYYVEYPMAQERGLKRFVLHAMQDGTYKCTPLYPNADAKVSVERLKAMFPELIPAFDANVFVYKKSESIKKIQTVIEQRSNDVYASLLNILLSDRELIKKRISLSALIQKYASSGKYLKSDKDNQILNKRNQDWDVYISSKNVYDLTSNLIKNGRLTEDSFFYKKIGTFLNNVKHHPFPETMIYSDEILAFIEKTLKEQTKDPKLIEFINCYAKGIFYFKKISIRKIKNDYPLLHDYFFKRFNDVSFLSFLKNYDSSDLFKTYSFFGRKFFKDRLETIAKMIENANMSFSVFVLVALFLHSLGIGKNSVAKIFLRKINELPEEEARKIENYFHRRYLKSASDLIRRRYGRQKITDYVLLYFKVRFYIPRFGEILKNLRVGPSHYIVAYDKFKNDISIDEIKRIDLKTESISSISTFLQKYCDSSSEEFLNIFFDYHFNFYFFILIYVDSLNGLINFSQTFLTNLFKKKMTENFHEIVLKSKEYDQVYFYLIKLLKLYGYDFLTNEQLKILVDVFETNVKLQDFFYKKNRELYDFISEITMKINSAGDSEYAEFVASAKNVREIGNDRYACDKIIVRSKSDFEFNSYFKKLVEANDVLFEDVKFKSFENFSCSTADVMRFKHCEFPRIVSNKNKIECGRGEFELISNFPEKFQNEVFFKVFHMRQCNVNLAFIENLYFQHCHFDDVVFKSGSDFFVNLISKYDKCSVRMRMCNFEDDVIDLKNKNLSSFSFFFKTISSILNLNAQDVELNFLDYNRKIILENCSFSSLRTMNENLSNLRFKNFSPLGNGLSLTIYIRGMLYFVGEEAIDFIKKLSV